MHLHQTRWKQELLSILRQDLNGLQEGSALASSPDTVYERTDNRNQSYQASETTQSNQNELNHVENPPEERCTLVMSAA
jgi:hypothetical protein